MTSPLRLVTRLSRRLIPLLVALGAAPGCASAPLGPTTVLPRALAEAPAYRISSMLDPIVAGDDVRVEVKYFWSAPPQWGEIVRVEREVNEYNSLASVIRNPYEWQRTTENFPITGVARKIEKRRLFIFTVGKKETCYTRRVSLSQWSYADASADPTVLTHDRDVVGFADEVAERPDVSCEGFDAMTSIYRNG